MSTYAHPESLVSTQRLTDHLDDVLQLLGKVGHLLVDTRSAEMYSGLDKAGAARGGHIPGAVNLAARRETNPDGSFNAWRVPTVQPDGTFKSAAELRALFDSLGITSDKEIITYCVRGGLSTHAWFVLTQLLGYPILGYPTVREYDRSWADMIALGRSGATLKAFLLSHNCLGSPPVPPNIGFQPTRYATRAAEPCRWADFKCGTPRHGKHQGIDRHLGRHVP